MFGSVRCLLEAVNQDATDEAVWDKMAHVQAKLRENIACHEKNNKMAKTICKALEKRLAQFQDMPQFLQQLRTQQLQIAEPENIWDDLELAQPATGSKRPLN